MSYSFCKYLTNLFSKIYLFYAFVVFFPPALSYNIDTLIPIVKEGEFLSNFGYSVSVQHDPVTHEPSLLIGAPNGTSNLDNLQNTGALYNCPFSYESTDCQLLDIQKRKTFCYEQTESDGVVKQEKTMPCEKFQKFGASIASFKPGVSSQNDDVNYGAVVCAPLRYRDKRGAGPMGTCYQLNHEDEQVGEDITQWFKMYNGRDFFQGSRAVESGFSIDTEQKNAITFIGGTNYLNWRGGVDVVSLIRNSRAANRRYRHSSHMTESTNDVNERIQISSFLGYSIAHGKFGFPDENPNSENDYSITVAAGAPRSDPFNLMTGKVYFFNYHWDPAWPKEDSPHHSSRNGDKQTVLPLLSFSLQPPTAVVGAYFGSSVISLDINNDKFDDLVVGAPHYFDVKHPDQEGAAFVYFSRARTMTSDRTNPFNQPISLRQNGSFGMALAVLGDINKDDYNDFAVGAPMYDENRGAVFIYLGGKNSVKLSQTILASKFRGVNSLQLFGFSLNGDFDADGNGYNDLSIGAVGSDKAVTLRTQSLAFYELLVANKDMRDSTATLKNLNYDAKTKPQFPPLDLKSDHGKKCLGSDGVACYSFVIMVRQVANAPEASVRDTTPIYVNCKPVLTEGARAVRATLNDKTYFDLWTDLKKFKTTIEIGIGILNDPDRLRPLSFRCFISLRNMTTSDKDHPAAIDMDPRDVNLNDYPIFSTENQIDLTFQIQFAKQCGSDGKCNSDLEVACKPKNAKKINSGESRITYIQDVSSNNQIQLEFSVTNNAEDAHEPRIEVIYNSELLKEPKLLGNSKGVSKSQNGIIILASNPFTQKSNAEFILAFDLVDSGHDLLEPLEFDVFSITSSEDDNFNTSQASFSIKIRKLINLKLEGKSTPSEVYFGGTPYGMSAISETNSANDIGKRVTHTYTISNEGKFKVSDVVLQIRWPLEHPSNFNHGKYLFYLTKYPTIAINKQKIDVCEVSRQGEVELSYVNELHVHDAPQSKREATAKRKSLPQSDLAHRLLTSTTRGGQKFITLDCTEQNEKCVDITCTIPNLEGQQQARIEINARVWNSTFVVEYYDIDLAKVYSTAKLKLSLPNNTQEVDSSDNSFMILTGVKNDLPPYFAPYKAPFWIYFVAIIAGIILLAVIALIGYYFGCFKRKQINAQKPQSYRAEIRRASDEED